MKFPLQLTAALFAFSFTHAQVLIKNTSVIDVENKKVLAGYNVLALDGRIVSVDKGKTYKLPEGTTVIDGTGKYLMPGLADAHIHFFQDGGLYARPDVIDLRKIRPYQEEIDWTHRHMQDFLRMYTRAGITSVIDVGATVSLLRQRDSFASKPWSPLVSMTGALLTTYIPAPYTNLGDDSPFMLMKTPDSVRLQVRQLKEAKADFVKIWYIVQGADVEKAAKASLPMVQAAIDEGHKLGMRVAVHGTEMITAQLAVEAGADFLVHSVEDRIVSKEFASLLKKKKTVLCPTLVVYDNYNSVLSGRYRFAPGELSNTHPTTAATVIDYPAPDTALGRKMITLASSPASQAAVRSADSTMMANLKILSDAGVIIASGTDAGNIGTQHVSSYFIELALMKQAGLDNWTILQASTLNPAKAVGRESEWGSIAKGRVANLLLLDVNPVDSIGALKDVRLVINKGRPVQRDSALTWSAADLAQIQLNAYNAHDLEGFLEPYADDVEVYGFPDKLLAKGKEQMRKMYGFLEKSPTLYCRLMNRIVQGNMVIDHEEILGIPGAPQYGVAIYITENGKIRKVYFPD